LPKPVLGHPLGCELVVDPVGPRDRVGLGGQGDADLVPPSEGHLQRRCGADLRVERDRLDVGALEQLRHLLGPLPGEVEVNAFRSNDRPVHDVRSKRRDPPHALGRDRVRFHESAVEAEREDLLGDLLGDRRWADAQNHVGRTDELID
jgi:hypothetical protein